MKPLRGLQRAHLWDSSGYVCYSCRHKLRIGATRWTRLQSNITRPDGVGEGDDWLSNFNDLSDLRPTSKPTNFNYSADSKPNLEYNASQRINRRRRVELSRRERTKGAIDARRKSIDDENIVEQAKKSLERTTPQTADHDFACLKMKLWERQGISGENDSRTPNNDAEVARRSSLNEPDEQIEHSETQPRVNNTGSKDGGATRYLSTSPPTAFTKHTAEPEPKRKRKRSPADQRRSSERNEAFWQRKRQEAQNKRSQLHSIPESDLKAQQAVGTTRSIPAASTNPKDLESRTQFETTISRLQSTINHKMQQILNTFRTDKKATVVESSPEDVEGTDLESNSEPMHKHISMPSFGPAPTAQQSRRFTEINSDTTSKREIESTIAETRKRVSKPIFTAAPSSTAKSLRSAVTARSDGPLSLAQMVEESRARPKWGGIATESPPSNLKTGPSTKSLMETSSQVNTNVSLMNESNPFASLRKNLQDETVVPSRNEDGDTGFLETLQGESQTNSASIPARGDKLEQATTELSPDGRIFEEGGVRAWRIRPRPERERFLSKPSAKRRSLPPGVRRMNDETLNMLLSSGENATVAPALVDESSNDVASTSSLSGETTGNLNEASPTGVDIAIGRTNKPALPNFIAPMVSKVPAEREANATIMDLRLVSTQPSAYPKFISQTPRNPRPEIAYEERFNAVNAESSNTAISEVEGASTTAASGDPIDRNKPSATARKITYYSNSSTPALGMDHDRMTATETQGNDPVEQMPNDVVVSNTTGEIDRSPQKEQSIATTPMDTFADSSTSISSQPKRKESRTESRRRQRQKKHAFERIRAVEAGKDNDNSTSIDHTTDSEPSITRAAAASAAAQSETSSTAPSSSMNGSNNGGDDDDGEHKPLWEVMGRSKLLGKGLNTEAATAVEVEQIEQPEPVPLDLSSSEPADVLSITPASLKVKALNIPQPSVPDLEYGLDRVLFNPGVYQLQDPLSRVFNFDPYLQKIMPVVEFDFNALKEYKTSSQDFILATLAKEHEKRYIGSTSSMTGMLGHFHYLLSDWRPLNVNMLSRSFPDKLDTFTLINRAPNAIFLRWRNGTYAIDADKQYDSGNVLMLLGKSMEKLLTMPTSDYERYRKSDTRTVSEEERTAPEAFEYTTMGDFLMRSQLDAHDPRLPGTGMFDLKTRAVLSVRMNADDFQPMTGYEIQTLQGRFASYEREYYDMIRSTMLKYMLQARMGRMDGIFVAYHNVERIFGFQYVPIIEMDRAIHGQVDRCLGDQEFKTSLDLMNKVFDKATAKFPEQSLRFHFETTTESLGGSPTTVMWIFAEPVTDTEIDSIQSTSKAKIAEFERTMMGVERDAEPTTLLENANGESDTRAAEILDTDVLVHTQRPPAPKSNVSSDHSSDYITSSSGADPNFLDSIASSSSHMDQRPLFAASLICKSHVNGVSVPRPDGLKPADVWEIEYLLREWNAPEAMWARYEQMKARRKELMEKYRSDDESAENNDGEELTRKQKREKAFTDFLKSMSQRGRDFRSKMDKLEAGKDPVVVGQTLPSSNRVVEEEIGDVEGYMAWLYGNGRGRAE